MNALLEVDGLTAGYGPVDVVHEVSFRVEPGQIVSIIGSNGAGKSTVLRALTGLLSPTSGVVRFRGRDLAGAPTRLILATGAVLVPEGRQLFPSLSVEENLRMGAFRHRKDMDHWRGKVLELFPVLGDRMAQRAETLSGGEQQMLAIGRGLMSQPELLMLDEPSLGLAPVLVDQVIGAIGQLRDEGISVLLVEQNVQQALMLSDYGYVLETGHVVQEGPAADLLDDDAVRRAYLGV